MSRRKQSDMNGFEAWGGYMNAKIVKLEEQFQHDAKCLDPNTKLSNMFEGVSIFVNGLTEPPSEVLRRLMLQHGGTFHDYEVAGTTHVIASNLPNAKLQQQAYARVVRPEWIVDSIAAGKLLKTCSYLLTARSALQPALSFQATPTESGKKAPAKTAVDSNFINEFYNNSRLHHLSTMGAMFKQYVGKIKEDHDGKFQGLARLRAMIEKDGMKNTPAERTIMHIDMDSFFVSVALRDRPELKGKPVAVCHAKGNNVQQREGANPSAELALYQARTGGAVDSRFVSKGGAALTTKESMSEVASCSYEARALGVKNGMYLGRALSLCPGLITVPYDFAAYTEVSYALYDTVAEYTLSVEAVSCDEMFIDCLSVLKATGASAMQFAKQLRSEVTERTRCPCSTGIGANKLVARLASRKAKPNGQYHVLSTEVEQFMSDVLVKELPGVGWSTGKKLKDMGIETCLDMQSVSLSQLKLQLGDKTGDTFYKYCRGIDDRSVVTEHQRKSVSAEVNYGIRFTNSSEAEDFLRRLSAEVSDRLSALNLRGRSITLKLLTRSADAPVEAAKFLGHGVCDAVSRSVILPKATSDTSVIAENVLKLSNQLGVSPEEMRGIGIQVTKLDSKVESGTLQSFLAKHCGKVRAPKAKAENPLPSASVENIPKEDIPTLQTAQNTQSSKHIKTPFPAPVLPPLSQLDPDFLKALPKELQKEILAQYGRTSLPENTRPSTPEYVSGTEHKDSGVMQPDLIDANSRDSTDLEKIENPFKGMSSKELRSAVSSWIETEKIPQECDVDMLGGHLTSLVNSREIETVSETLLCFWRCTRKYRKDAAEWTASYRSVVDQIQSSMLGVYGNPLLVNEI